MGIKFSVTFDVVTPESAAVGEYAETGFECEPADLAFDPVYETAAERAADHVEQWCGHCEASSSGPLRVGSWLTSADGDLDYSTGAVTRHSVHFSDQDDEFMQALAVELVRRGLLPSSHVKG